MHRHPQALESRIHRLERTNRVLTGAVLALIGLVLVAAVRPPQDVVDLVRAKRIQLVDDDGLVRIDLRHDSTETGMFILDAAGDTRVGAAQFAHGGGGFALHGPEMRGAAVLYLLGDGRLSFYDATGELKAEFGPGRNHPAPR